MVGSSGPCPGPWLRLVLPAQLQAQHDGPKGDVILLPGVQPFSKQLLASSVGVCQGKRNLLWATVLSRKGPHLRECILDSPPTGRR